MLSEAQICHQSGLVVGFFLDSWLLSAGGAGGLRRGRRGYQERRIGGNRVAEIGTPRRGIVEEQGWNEEQLPPPLGGGAMITVCRSLLEGGCCRLSLKGDFVTFFRFSLKGRRCGVCRGRQLCTVLCGLMSWGVYFYRGRRTGKRSKWRIPGGSKKRPKVEHCDGDGTYLRFVD